MTNIFRSGAFPQFTIFAVPETIIFKVSLRSSCSLPPTAAYCSQPKTQRVRAAPSRLVAGQNDIQTRPTTCTNSVPEDPHFHARARSGAPYFHALPRSGAPNFQFAMAHTYQNLG